MDKSERRILCLTAGEELVGFVTGAIQSDDSAVVDGVYVIHGWQRQYWGARMLNALREDFQENGIEKIQAILF